MGGGIKKLVWGWITKCMGAGGDEYKGYGDRLGWD